MHCLWYFHCNGIEAYWQLNRAQRGLLLYPACFAVHYLPIRSHPGRFVLLSLSTPSPSSWVRPWAPDDVHSYTPSVNLATDNHRNRQPQPFRSPPKPLRRYLPKPFELSLSLSVSLRLLSSLSSFSPQLSAGSAGLPTRAPPPDQPPAPAATAQMDRRCGKGGQQGKGKGKGNGNREDRPVEPREVRAAKPGLVVAVVFPAPPLSRESLTSWWVRFR